MKRLIIALLLSLSLLTTAHALDPLNLPTPYDMVMLAGADYNLDLQVKVDSVQMMDITGYEYAAQFRSAPAPAGLIFANFSTPITSGVGGNMQVRLSKAQTLTLSGKSGVWDLRQTTGSGIVSYILSGKAYVRPTVTQ